MTHPRRSILLMALAAVSMQLGCGEAPRRDDAAVQPIDGLSASGDVPSELLFAVTPAAGKDTDTLLAPLKAFLTKRLQLPVEGRTAVSYDDVARMVNDGEVNMGIMSPAAYVQARRNGLKAVPVATATRGGSPTYLGYLVAKGTWPPPHLKAFAGKRMAWVNPASTSGYLYAREMMRDRQLDPDTFFGSTFFAKNHHAAVKAVADGEADLAAVGGPFVDPDGDLQVPGAKELVVVAKTRRIPLDCIVVRESLQRDLARRLQSALITLSNDAETSQKLADSWGLGGFVHPMTKRYDEVARVLDRTEQK